MRTGLVIGLLLLAMAGPAAATSPAALWDLAERNHDPAHWVWGVLAPILDFLASKVTDPLAAPKHMGEDGDPEAGAA